MSSNIQLWEVLVPTARRVPAKEYKGKTFAHLKADATDHIDVPCTLRYHRVWDNKVEAIAGGLTILKPNKGKWRDGTTNTVYVDRVIPVRIACSKEKILEIIQLTLSHYNQLAVMAYKISDEVLLINRT